MTFSRAQTNDTAKSDEFIQLIKNRNNGNTTKPVFRKLFGFVESENKDIDNVLEAEKNRCKTINVQEERIKMNNEENAKHEVRTKKEKQKNTLRLKTLTAMCETEPQHSNNKSFELKKSLKITYKENIEEVSFSEKTIKIQDTMNNEIISAAETLESDGQEVVLDKTPFYMPKEMEFKSLNENSENLNSIETENITCNESQDEKKPIGQNNNKKVTKKDENKPDIQVMHMNENNSAVKTISSTSHDTIVYNTTNDEVSKNDTRYSKNNNSHDNITQQISLKQKIQSRRMRNRTICITNATNTLTEDCDTKKQSFAEDVNASGSNERQIPELQSAKAVCEKLEDKIKNKRARNRTICDASDMKEMFNLMKLSVPGSNVSFVVDDVQEKNVFTNKSEVMKIEEAAGNDSDIKKLEETNNIAQDATNKTEAAIDTNKNSKSEECENKLQRIVERLNNENGFSVLKDDVPAAKQDDVLDNSVKSIELGKEANESIEKNKFIKFTINNEENILVLPTQLEKREIDTNVNKHVLTTKDDESDEENFEIGSQKRKNNIDNSAIDEEIRGDSKNSSLTNDMGGDLNDKMKTAAVNNNFTCSAIFKNDKNSKVKGKSYDQLTSREKTYFTMFCRDCLKKEIRTKGIFANIKRFFTKMFESKWHEKKIEKMKSKDKIIEEIGEILEKNAKNTKSIFRLSADRHFYYDYPKKIEQKTKVDFKALNAHENGAIYKGYIKNVIKGFIPSKVAKNIVAVIKSKDINETNKAKILRTLLPFLMSEHEKQHVKEIFELWKPIAHNYNITQMDIGSLCVIFGPSIINDEFIVNMEDFKYLPKILEYLYECDFDNINIELYDKFRKKYDRIQK